MPNFRKHKPRNQKNNFLKQYRSEIKIQSKNNNLDYMIDPIFRIVNRLFVLSFKNDNNDSKINYFDKFYM